MTRGTPHAIRWYNLIKGRHLFHYVHRDWEAVPQRRKLNQFFSSPDHPIVGTHIGVIYQVQVNAYTAPLTITHGNINHHYPC